MIFKNHRELIDNGKTETIRQKRSDILTILDEMSAFLNPYQLVSSHIYENRLILSTQSIDPADYHHLFLIGFGKASVRMAQAVCDIIKVHEGAVITNDTTATVSSPNIKTYYGGHPLPNQGSIQATEQLIKLTKKCSSNDLLVVLISGGGSALLCHPKITLEDLQTTTSLLLRAGASITELNTIRKHLSNVKGGQLISSIPCQVISLVLSDVINDPLSFIASGPTFPDETTFHDAHAILSSYALWHQIPSSVQTIIRNGEQGLIMETPTMNASFFDHVTHEIIGNNTLACQQAAQSAQRLGYHPEIISTSITGQAREQGPRFIYTACPRTTDKTSLFIGGGETTVTVQGSGKGGRNQEMVLGSLKTIEQTDMVFACLATDGYDGTSPVAGAIADGYSLQRARHLQLDPTGFLNQNDSYHFFESMHDHLHTGPTGSNVMDVFILIP